MRYSDDFTVVIPNIETLTSQALQDISTCFNAVAGLTLEPYKTWYFTRKILCVIGWYQRYQQCCTEKGKQE